MGAGENRWRLATVAVDQHVEDWSQWCRHRIRRFQRRSSRSVAGPRKSGDIRLGFFDGDRLLAALFIARRPVAVAAPLGDRAALCIA